MHFQAEPNNYRLITLKEIARTGDYYSWPDRQTSGWCAGLASAVQAVHSCSMKQLLYLSCTPSPPSSLSKEYNKKDFTLCTLQAQPKHLSCIAVSSFHLACSQYQQVRGDLLVLPQPSDLVSISQSRCSASDLLRMEAIIASKLENKQQQVKLPAQAPVMTGFY